MQVELGAVSAKIVLYRGADQQEKRMKYYGTSLSIGLKGVTLVVNGYMLSLFKGLNTGKWQATFSENIWRKTGEQVPSKVYRFKEGRKVKDNWERGPIFSFRCRKD